MVCKMWLMARKHSGEPFPEGSNFSARALIAEEACDLLTRGSISESDRQLLEEIGTVLSLLYRFATCYWGCHGKGHGIESLAGRAFTSSRSAVRLIGFGYYDEAFALIRGIGELGNLLFLFMLKPEALRHWFVVSEADRWKHFGPGKVRKAIKTAGSIVPIDEAQYSWLCGVGVHVNPETTPQTHNKEKQPHLGAFFQKDGHTKAIATLGWCLFITFGVIAKNANVDGIYKDEMKKAWEKLGEVLGNHPEVSSGS
jgi:hypothetical protein